MSESKRHHYISDFLCKFFTHDDISLYRFDNKQKKIIEISKKDGFVQNDLNTLEYNGIKDRTTIEQYFQSEFEGPASQTINNLISKINSETYDDTIFNETDYTNLLKFCILSHIRTPNKLKELKYSSIQRNILLSLENNSQPIYPEITDDFVLLKAIEHVPDIYDTIRGISFKIIYHKSQSKYFVLPDQPVAIHTNHKKEFASTDLIITLPISNNILIMFDRNCKQNQLIRIDNEDKIDKLNKTICKRFYNYIACKSYDYLDRFTKTNSLIPIPMVNMDIAETEIQQIVDNIKKQIKEGVFSPKYIKLSKNGAETLDMI